MTGILPVQKRRLTIATLAGALIIIAIMVSTYWNLQQDDSYFTYSYAKNLANGNGYVFNVGERVNATTSPLYTLLLALLYSVLRYVPFVTIPLIGHLVGAVSLFLICFFLIRSFRSETDSFYPFAVAIVFLANPLLPHATGMETYMAMMLAVMSLSFYARSRLTAAATACSFAVLARPDMLLMAFALVGYHAIRHRRLPSTSVISAFVLPIAAWLVFSLAYFGELLPTTLSAKLAQTEAGIWGPGLVYLKALPIVFFWYGQTSYQAAVVVALLIGLVVLLLRYRQWGIFRQPVFHLIIIWTFLYVIAYGLVMNAPAYFWYYTPLALCLALISALPIEGVYRLLSHRSAAVDRILLPVIYLALILAALWLPLKWSNAYFAAEYKMYPKAAAWLNANVPQGSSVGAGEIGILRYYYENGPVIDAAGLTNPDVIEHLREGDFYWYVYRYEPDYLMLNHRPPNEFDPMIDEDWFKRDYRLCTVIGADGHEVGIYERQVSQNISESDQSKI